jgi:CheY-like chemotaxis protein
MKNEQIKDVDVAYNGFEGYNKSMVKEYDFIICDLNMPVMDGFLFCTNFIKYFEDKINFFDPK